MASPTSSSLTVVLGKSCRNSPARLDFYAYIVDVHHEIHITGLFMSSTCSMDSKNFVSNLEAKYFASAPHFTCLK
jgi:hypothetical protein